MFSVLTALLLAGAEPSSNMALEKEIKRDDRGRNQQEEFTILTNSPQTQSARLPSLWRDLLVGRSRFVLMSRPCSSNLPA